MIDEFAGEDKSLLTERELCERGTAAALEELTRRHATGDEHAPPCWAEFTLRAGGGTKRVLMQRRRNGPDSTWRDIAAFDSYNDAEHILRLLQQVSQSGSSGRQS